MMNDTHPPLRAAAWQTSRRQNLIRAGVLLALLALTAIFVLWTRQHLEDSRATAASQRLAANDALALKAARAVNATLDERANQLLAEASLRGIRAEDWAKRLVDVRQQTAMTRGDANEFLLSIAHTPRRFFDLESFEIAVRGDETGIFDPPARANSTLLLGARGALIFRTQENKP
ncbi:hypothetical protein AGMMS50289_14660 [Betaproteobacteria bacterium]|nr:hypothetical protein FACS1894101_2210 [Betaproteobacteria bacterium]GHU44941.1 hypothetical protein AGMMS50289_14660 [Betaproteobacteria bacterium]